MSGGGQYVWGFASQCAETWFYGGDIFINVTAPSTNPQAVYLSITGGLSGDLRVFGTTVRTLINTEILGAQNAMGAEVIHGSTLHAHGSIFNVSTAPGLSEDVNVIGIRTGSDSLAHTPGTAFALKASGTGTTARLVSVNNGAFDSPFLWQSGSTPPAATTETNVLTSVDGEDIYVETDCDSTGDCDGAGTETHMMIHNATLCGSSNPWFDSTAGACRQ